MNKTLVETLCQKIQSQLECACEYYPDIQNDTTLAIPPDRIADVIKLIEEDKNDIHLSTITAQQRENHPDEIEVMYHFYLKVGFSLLTSIPCKDPQLPSIVSIIPGADFYEREVAEMFGVKFIGRSETPRLLLPEDWDQGPPFVKNEVKDD